MRERLLREQKGFTLIEVLVTMIIMIVVLFALYGIFDMGIRVFSSGNSEVEATENARLGLEKMDREIQAAYAYNRGAATPDTVLLKPGDWTATQIKFGNDLNGNLKITGDEATEKISYTADNSEQLKRSVNGGAAQPVVEYVDYLSATDTGLKFTYFKSDGTTEVVPGVGNEAEIAMVRIELRIRVENGFGDGTQTLTTDVALRNRGG